MSWIKIALNPFLIICILATIASCKGQSHPSADVQSKALVSVSIGDTVSIVGRNIRCIFQDKQDDFWFASDGDGLFKYDGKTLLQITDKHGLPGNLVREVKQDEDGTLLVTTAKGICTFDGQKFNSIQPIENIITNTDFSNATILLGYYYQNKVMKPFQIPQTSKLSKSYSQTPYAIYCALKDHKGNIWFGTESRGVCKYDGKTFTWLDSEELGLAVRCIFEDKSGNIWIGNNGYGLFCYDGKKLSNFTKEHKLENIDFQTTLKGKEGTLARVWTITDDHNGNLWIGTIDAGLWKYAGDKLTNYTVEDGLTSNSIAALYCDKNGLLWIGCDNGVITFDGKAFHAFNGQH